LGSTRCVFTLYGGEPVEWPWPALLPDMTGLIQLDLNITYQPFSIKTETLIIAFLQVSCDNCTSLGIGWLFHICK
jgi:hypothetical protein